MFLNGHKDKFQIIENKIFNMGLSLKAIGLYAYLNSKPEDWEFSYKNISAELKEGEKALRSAVKELVDKKLLVRIPKKSEDGQLKGWIWVLNPTEEHLKVIDPFYRTSHFGNDQNGHDLNGNDQNGKDGDIISNLNSKSNLIYNIYNNNIYKEDNIKSNSNIKESSIVIENSNIKEKEKEKSEKKEKEKEILSSHPLFINSQNNNLFKEVVSSIRFQELNNITSGAINEELVRELIIYREQLGSPLRTTKGVLAVLNDIFNCSLRHKVSIQKVFDLMTSNEWKTIKPNYSCFEKKSPKNAIEKANEILEDFYRKQKIKQEGGNNGLLGF